MKKFRKILIISLIVISALCFAFCAACGTNGGTESENVNVYNGNGHDFYLKNWVSSPFGVYGFKDGENMTVTVNKAASDNAYSFMYTEVDGDLADFCYINLKIKSSVLGSRIRVRIGYDCESLEANFIGWDNDFSISREFETYTLKIKGTYQARLDIASVVAVYAYMGEITTFEEVWEIGGLWFSKTAPENSVFKNENVDTSNDSFEEINGWKNYSWTNYSIIDDKSNGNELIIKTTKAADWANVEKSLDGIIENGKNAISFKFINEKLDNKGFSSVTRMSFMLKGDFKEIGYTNEGYEYNSYYEYTLGYYTFDGNSVINDRVETVNLSLTAAFTALEGHLSEGISLKVLVESDLNTKGVLDPDNIDSTYNYNGRAQLTIVSLTGYMDEDYVPTGWLSDAWTGYRIEDKSGVATVSFDNATAWGSVYKVMEDVGDNDTLKFVFNNEILNDNVGSITQISFKLRGDKSGTAVNEDEVEYDTFHEILIHRYYYDGISSVDNPVELKIDIVQAMQTLSGKYENGLKLVVFIETDKDEEVKIEGEYPFDSSGKISILEAEFIKSNKE